MKMSREYLIGFAAERVGIVWHARFMKKYLMDWEKELPNFLSGSQGEIYLKAFHEEFKYLAGHIYESV